MLLASLIESPLLPSSLPCHLVLSGEQYISENASQQATSEPCSAALAWLLWHYDFPRVSVHVVRLPWKF